MDRLAAGERVSTADRFRVLVVDDESENTELVRRTLISEFEIVTAANGKEGLTTLEAQPVEMVISDQRMPILAGIDFLEEVRRKYPDVIRILLTAYPDTPELIGAINRGEVFRYLTKPISPHTLLDAVHQGIDHYRAEADRRHLVAELQLRNDKIREAQEKLAQMNASLEREVASRTAALERALNARSMFLAKMSHELRTPLNAVIGFSRLLQRTATHKLDERELRNLELIYDSGQHLLVLVDDLLDLESIESGGLRVKLVNVDVAPLLQDLKVALQPAAEARNIDLKVEVGRSLRVQTDPDRVRQILTNLIGNAIKYSGSPHVLIRVDQTEREILFQVCDAGRGLSPDELSRIFEPFHQVDQVAPDGQPRGVGLGLAIATQLARLLGGRLEAESAVGVGTTFTLTLPAERE